jgi:hypothetical protein
MGPTEAPLITEDWLRDCGFKWEQLDRQPHKSWLLWIGMACVDYGSMFRSSDNLGIELSKILSQPKGYRYDLWNCWIRNDIAGRYARIIHVRYVYLQSEVEHIIAALTGRRVEWRDSMYGSLHDPVSGEQLRHDRMRLDQRINHAWVDRVDAEKGISGIDKDKRGATLP